MTQQIGIIGISPEGSSICYRIVGRLASGFDSHDHRPNVMLHNHPFSRYVELIKAEEWERVAELILDSVQSLARCGATFCIMPDNVTHHVMPMVAANAPIPVMNMVEIVAQHVEQEGFSEVGLIGTKFVTFGSTYQTILGMQGVKLRVPTEEEAEQIDTVIFGEAVFGSVTETSCRTVGDVIEQLKGRGCDAVILGASEAALMLRNRAFPLPLIDPVELLSRAAIKRCLDEMHTDDATA